MNPIRKIFDSQRGHFTGEGRLSGLYPFFDALETVFFTPVSPTETDPHVRDSIDLKRFMSFVILALVPTVLFGVWNTGYQSLILGGTADGRAPTFMAACLRGAGIFVPMLVVSYAAGLFWETLFASVRGHHISEGFLVSGLLFPLTLPPTIPLWQVAVGISFGIVIGKEVFGGTGRNFLNPALTGRAFLFFAYPARMTGDGVWVLVEKGAAAGVDAVSGATPLATAAQVAAPDRIEAVLSGSGIGFWELLAGNYPGTIGGTSALMSLCGVGLLILVGIASWRIVAGGVLGILGIGWLLNALAGGASSPWFLLNPFYHLVMGGAAFGLAYMATDPVTAPGTDSGRWIYGFCIGALTVLIRIFNPAYPEGIMLAILFMNVFSPLIDYVTVKRRLKKRMVNV